jgi:hypothetical protein
MRREGEPVIEVPYVCWREVGDNLKALPAYGKPLPSPSPIFDPEIGVTTSHDAGVW